MRRELRALACDPPMSTHIHDDRSYTKPSAWPYHSVCDLRLPRRPDSQVNEYTRVKNFSVKQFIAQANIEPLDEAVFPRRARRNVGYLRSDGRDPKISYMMARTRVSLTSSF